MPEAELRAMRNCDGTGEGASLDFYFDSELHRCPWAAIRDIDPWGRAQAIIAAWRRWTALGVLPYGALRMADLPQPIFEAFEICAEVGKALEKYLRNRDRSEDRRVLLNVIEASMVRR